MKNTREFFATIIAVIVCLAIDVILFVLFWPLMLIEYIQEKREGVNL